MAIEKNCPKCGKKLSVFYVKPNCPSCGCEIAYYNMDKVLEEDSIKAEAEFEKLEAFVEKITPKFIKNKRNKKAEESAETSDVVEETDNNEE